MYADSILESLNTAQREAVTAPDTNLLVLAVSLLPMVALFDDGAANAWHLWVPALAQISLMGEVLKGEPLSLAGVLGPLAVALPSAAARRASEAGPWRRAAVR